MRQDKDFVELHFRNEEEVLMKRFYKVNSTEFSYLTQFSILWSFIKSFTVLYILLRPRPRTPNFTFLQS